MANAKKGNAMNGQDHPHGTDLLGSPRTGNLGVIVIDDDPIVRESLGRMLEAISGVELLDLADSCISGIASIRAYAPQVVFLDVEMPDGSGFDVLDALDNIPLLTIFITAYETYALRATRYSAIDLLLKPFGPEDVLVAVEKAFKRISTHPAHAPENTQHATFTNRAMEPRIGLCDQQGTHFFNIDDIVRCRAEGNYTTFHFICGRKMVVSALIKEFEERLQPHGFSRVHRSHLINLRHMTRYISAGNGSVITSDGAEIEISRARRPHFLRMLTASGITLRQ
jgi:two-component system LytT family response regulator